MVTTPSMKLTAWPVWVQKPLARIALSTNVLMPDYP